MDGSFTLGDAEARIRGIKRACDIGAVAVIVHGSINGRHLTDPDFAQYGRNLMIGHSQYLFTLHTQLVLS